MTAWHRTLRRLDRRGPASRGPASRGLVVDAEGVALGADCILVRRTDAGFGADPDAVARLPPALLGPDPDRLARQLARIAKALDAGDLVMAQLIGLDLPISVPDRGPHAVAVTKDFNQDEPRNDHGEWTKAGEAALAAVGTGLRVVAEDLPDALSLYGTMRADVVAGLRLIAGAVAAAGATAEAAIGLPALILGTIFIPFNKNVVTDGVLPARPDVSYRFNPDERSLELTQGGASLYSDHADVNGVFRDADGHAFAREVDGAVVLDPDAMPAFSARAAAPAADPQRPGSDPWTITVIAAGAAGATRFAPLGCGDNIRAEVVPSRHARKH